jgi:hypothetical protein
MVLDRAELDRIVYDAISDLSSLKPPPNCEEIAASVLDHIKQHILEYVMPSIERLVANEQVIEDRDDSRGRPYVYYLPPSPFQGRKL